MGENILWKNIGDKYNSKIKETRVKDKIFKGIKNIFVIFLTAFLITILIRIFIIEVYTIEGSSMSPTFSNGDELVVLKLIAGPIIPVVNLKLPMILTPKKGDIIIFQNINYKKPLWYQELIDFITLGRINFDWKKGNDKIIIKRVIACPNDNVAIINGNSQEIYVNNKMLERELISKEWDSTIFKEINNNKQYIIKYNGTLPIDKYHNVEEMYIPKKDDVLKLEKKGTDTIVSIKINETVMNDEWIRKDCLDRIDEETEIDLRNFDGDELIYKIKNNYYFVRGDNRDNSRDSTYWGILREDLIIGYPLLRILPFKKFGTVN